MQCIYFSLYSWKYFWYIWLKRFWFKPFFIIKSYLTQSTCDLCNSFFKIVYYVNHYHVTASDCWSCLQPHTVWKEIRYAWWIKWVLDCCNFSDYAYTVVSTQSLAALSMARDLEPYFLMTWAVQLVQLICMRVEAGPGACITVPTVKMRGFRVLLMKFSVSWYVLCYILWLLQSHADIWILIMK